MLLFSFLLLNTPSVWRSKTAEENNYHPLLRLCSGLHLTHSVSCCGAFFTPRKLIVFINSAIKRIFGLTLCELLYIFELSLSRYGISLILFIPILERWDSIRGDTFLTRCENPLTSIKTWIMFPWKLLYQMCWIIYGGKKVQKRCNIRFEIWPIKHLLSNKFRAIFFCHLM